MTELIKTPYYLIDKSKLERNMEKIAYVREHSGAKALLALKCFATWSVFDFMSQYMDGTTSSSLNEVKLGKIKFPGETHAYSVAYADDEIDEVLAHSDKIIFNSISQLTRFSEASANTVRGLRLNPGVSSSDFLIADPARPFSRLGEWDAAKIEAVLPLISGFMIHNNCENGDFELFDQMLGQIEERFGHLLEQVSWVSLGGGIHFTGEGYPLDKLAVSTLQPLGGPRLGGTLVLLSGRHIGVSRGGVLCQFGESWVLASVVDEDSVRCTSPPHEDSSTNSPSYADVAVRLTVNGDRAAPSLSSQPF